ncbi:hypothetical protein NEIELOOT_02300 [Neisseria elongata subsp. glycolytica ATCC 29315]|uniref:Uncharacterized protein n=1 Tax=Neisseria elongata subsp. glycolytica ATCC 29315 TaxID=546263 RepID=D4DT98_NEIEG|nr:hypothetical protein NEIELOOT_02300 [Neisseria elongata subsp. glycolytica ATCC 29315]
MRYSGTLEYKGLRPSENRPKLRIACFQTAFCCLWRTDVALLNKVFIRFDAFIESDSKWRGRLKTSAYAKQNIFRRPL